MKQQYKGLLKRGNNWGIKLNYLGKSQWLNTGIPYGDDTRKEAERYYDKHLKTNRKRNSTIQRLNDRLELINKEKEMGLDKKDAYQNFTDNVNQIKNDLIKLLVKLKKDGKKVVAYGATSKSTTVTNYFGINSELIECIYDTTPIKQNKFSPGMHIPVLPYNQFRESDPDYVLLFAWNHATEIMKKEKDYMDHDRYWITYIPEVKVS